ncbi:MAG: ATP-binding protein [Thermodesulfovibrionia bacterium]
MKNLKILLGLFVLSILAIIITGVVLSYLGIEHGPLLIKTGFIFIIVNIILYLAILIFFVVRNFVSLYAEKKQKVIGSKFRTRLVVAFVGLTLIPSALLFVLSNQLINSSIDKWFSLEVQKPINDSMDIAMIFYSKERQNVLDYANFLASNASNKGLIDLNKFTENAKDNFKVYFLKNPEKSDFIKNVFNVAADVEIISSEKGDIIRAFAPVESRGKRSGVVIVETLIPLEFVTKMESIKKAYNEYNQIKIRQKPIRFIYFFMLTITTLVIIFLALWFSLRIAKGMTVPIQSLAEATKTVAHGDLDFRINIKRDDEIGLLINSFNKMLDDLRDGKQSIEQAYMESDRRRLSMEAILESINTGVIFLERSGNIATLNNAACSMLNLDRADMLGKSYKELLARIKSDDLSSLDRLDEKDFKATEKEIHAYIDGRPVNLRVYITVLKDSKGNFMGILVVFDDLTEIITAQRALAWQEVAKRITHEIKNPLTPIMLSTERLLKKWNDNAKDFGEVLKKSTKTILKEVGSLRNLVDEFSRFGKMPKINLESTNINSVIEEIVELYSDLSKIKIITLLQDLPEIDVDRDQLKRALINLIDNAIQAKTERIWLNTSFDTSLDSIRIEVIDEGTGIKEEDRNKLFLPDFSTKKEGMGLGLSIVSSIISKHRGYIRVKDNEPRGARFIIEIPVGGR